MYLKGQKKISKWLFLQVISDDDYQFDNSYIPDKDHLSELSESDHDSDSEIDVDNITTENFINVDAWFKLMTPQQLKNLLNHSRH